MQDILVPWRIFDLRPKQKVQWSLKTTMKNKLKIKNTYPPED